MHFNPKKSRRKRVTTLIYLFVAILAIGLLVFFGSKFGYFADQGTSKPNPPKNISSTFISETAIKIDWQDDSNDEVGFKLERAVGNPENFIESASIEANITTITENGLLSDATYYYRLYAYNALGNSEYSLITSPPKLQKKDYLLGYGDFEKSTVVETSTAFVDPTPGNQVANGWAKNFGGSATEANCLYQIEGGAGVFESNSQSIAIMGIFDSRASSCGAQKTIWYNENIFPVGSKISFGAGKLAFVDSNPLDYPLNYSSIYYRASLWGIDKNWLTVFNTQTDIYQDQTSLADLTVEIPAGVNRIFVSIKVYVVLNAGMTQPEGHNPGIMIDDAHLYVTKPGNIEPEQAEFPFVRERTMDTGMTFFNPRIHDPYEIARNLDWADTGFNYADNVLMLKKLNPNFKLYQYHNAATIADYRDTNYLDPVKYPISHRFGEVATNHPEWLYDRYDENNNDLVNWGDYEDLRLEYQKYYYDANGVLQSNKFFFDRAYTYIYSIDPSNTDYQNIWREEVIDYIRYFQSDGVFVDTLGATPPYTVTSGNADLFTLPDDIQKFTQAVYPDLRTAGIDIVHNYCSGHYDTYTGNVTLNPLWRESNLNDVGVPGLENMLTNYYNGTIPTDSFVDNTPQGVADTFFQEWAFFSAKTVNDMSVNSYGLNYWLDSLRDMDNVEIINQSMPDNLKKKILQYSIGTDYIDDLAEKADHSGWAQFVFGSFMLGKNDYTTFGMSRRSNPTDPLGTINVLINDYHSVSKELGYELSDRQILTELYSDSSLQIREFSKGLIVVNGNGTLDRNYTLANSMLDEDGNPISGAITLPPHSARILFNDLSGETVGVNLNLSLQGRTDFTASNISLKVYDIGQTTVLAEKNDISVDNLGIGGFLLVGLSSGSYNYKLKVPEYLIKLNSNVITTILTNLDFYQLTAGDLNNDNIINGGDFAVLNGSWFQTSPIADINQDGLVNGGDFAILNSNWFKQGD